MIATAGNEFRRSAKVCGRIARTAVPLLSGSGGKPQSPGTDAGPTCRSEREDVASPNAQRTRRPLCFAAIRRILQINEFAHAVLVGPPAVEFSPGW